MNRSMIESNNLGMVLLNRGDRMAAKDRVVQFKPGQETYSPTEEGANILGPVGYP